MTIIIQCFSISHNIQIMIFFQYPIHPLFRVSDLFQHLHRIIIQFQKTERIPCNKINIRGIIFRWRANYSYRLSSQRYPRIIQRIHIFFKPSLRPVIITERNYRMPVIFTEKQKTFVIRIRYSQFKLLENSSILIINLQTARKKSATIISIRQNSLC